jgi:hypothetical protein
MHCIDNLGSFPMVLQLKDDWCIPASIENVLKYYEFNLSQEKIFKHYKNVQDPKNMNFDDISNILEDLFGNDFNFEPKHHDSGNQLIEYAEKRIQNNLPVIVSMKLPDRDRPHMYTLVCVGDHNVKIFDTGGTQRFVTRSRQWLIDHLADGLGTLVIRPVE